ncbi:MAG: condensation domain-containing protein, partial [Ruminiclostridium sp.]
MKSIVQDAYPLCKLQIGMVFHTEKENKRIYHDIFKYKFLGVYNIAYLKKVIYKLVSENDILRTGFEISKYTEPLQLVYQSIEYKIDEFDLRSIDNLERDNL